MRSIQFQYRHYSLILKTNEHHIKLSDGRVLSCLELGAPEGTPVLYFHGFPGSRLEACLAAAPAERLGLRLLAPDRPGFGGSSSAPGRTIGGWAADVVRLANCFSLDRFYVLGVSGGGPYALACAARIPQRLDGIALVGSMGPIDSWELMKNMVRMNRMALALACRAPKLAHLLIAAACPWIRRHPERFLEHIQSAAPEADRAVLEDPDYRRLIAESTAEALRQGGRGAAWELSLLARPWNFALQAIQLPVRLWQGLDDNIVPPAIARHLEAELPCGEARYLPGEGHLSLIVRYLDTVLSELCTG